MKTQLVELIKTALSTLQEKKTLTLTELPEVHIEHCREKQHGDFSCNIAMRLAKTVGKPPREIAEQIVTHLPETPTIENTVIAGPGFINFFVTKTHLQDTVRTILEANGHYGEKKTDKQQRVHIEIVSANPTGPLHIGHGRLAAYGASVANLLEAAGYQVHREYYVNDAGRQMQILCLSIWLRYLMLFNENIPFPSGAYRGDYINDIAKIIKDEKNDQFCCDTKTLFENLPPDDESNKDKYLDALIEKNKTLLSKTNYTYIFEKGLNTILSDIKEDLTSFGVHYDNWFSEHELVKSGKAERGIEQLRANNHLYERDGALWFSATHFGDDKDRVVIRENGEYTYFANDIGYHLDKYERGFDRMIDVLGADHHGYTARIHAFLTALGKDANQLECLLVQFANLYRDKEKIAMSTRGGTFVTLRELRNEVGNDATRFFFVMRKHQQHLDFDLELAKSHSNENPVYYIQYAHARICSVFRQLNEKNLTWNPKNGLNALERLDTPHEKKLLQHLARYPETITNAVKHYDPHLIAQYLQELANCFHTYYNAHTFLVEDKDLCDARLAIITATRHVIAHALKLLGVSAPESM